MEWVPVIFMRIKLAVALGLHAHYMYKEQPLTRALASNFGQGGEMQKLLLGHAHFCDHSYFWC